MKKVLIVDDAAFMRASIKMMLQGNEFDVVGEAENGKVSINKYRELQPDIVTMDITMPDMTGIQALKEIMKLDPKARVVMVSAVGQEPMVKEAILSGAKSFILKPFNKELLVETLSKIAAV